MLTNFNILLVGVSQCSMCLWLQDIQEVTGYVLIMSSYAEYMPLTSLRIIRGRTLVFPDSPDEQGFSLYVSHNYKPGSLTVGLKELQLVLLHGLHLASPCTTIVIVVHCVSKNKNFHFSSSYRLMWTNFQIFHSHIWEEILHVSILR